MILFRISNILHWIKIFVGICHIWHFIYEVTMSLGFTNLWKTSSLSKAGQFKSCRIYFRNNKDELATKTLAKLSKDISVSENNCYSFCFYSWFWQLFLPWQQKLLCEASLPSVPLQRNGRDKSKSDILSEKFFQRNGMTATDL